MSALVLLLTLGTSTVACVLPGLLFPWLFACWIPSPSFLSIHTTSLKSPTLAIPSNVASIAPTTYSLYPFLLTSFIATSHYLKKSSLFTCLFFPLLSSLLECNLAAGRDHVLSCSVVVYTQCLAWCLVHSRWSGAICSRMTEDGDSTGLP